MADHSSTTHAEPSLADIGTAQREDRNVRRQVAARRFYADAKLLHFAGSTVAVVLALLVPLFVWQWPSQGPLLGAVAGVWIFLARLVLVPLRDRKRLQGALAQESFDCDVLGIEWSSGLGEPIAPEDTHRAAKRGGKWDTQDWYPTEATAPWPRSVLICQRSNAVWARRQHGGYGWLLLGLASAWGLAGVVIAIVSNATLAAYLTTIALPSLPALLDASEEARAHFRASQARQLLESAINAKLGSSGTDAAGLRAIQDQIYWLRRQAPLVPDWFYRLRRQDLEADMRDAARDLTTNPGS